MDAVLGLAGWRPLSAESRRRLAAVAGRMDRAGAPPIPTCTPPGDVTAELSGKAGAGCFGVFPRMTRPRDWGRPGRWWRGLRLMVSSPGPSRPGRTGQPTRDFRRHDQHCQRPSTIRAGTVASAWGHRHRPHCSRLAARGAAAAACAVIPNGTTHPLRLAAITGDGCQLFRIGHCNSTYGSGQ
jgi:hypothetical protein